MRTVVARIVHFICIMPFPLEITFLGMAPRGSIEERIRHFAAKLEATYQRIVRAQVVVEAPQGRHRHGGAYHVRIRLVVPGGELVVSRDPGRVDSHVNLHVALRDSFLAARRQVEDHVRRDVRHDVKAHAQPQPWS